MEQNDGGRDDDCELSPFFSKVLVRWTDLKGLGNCTLRLFKPSKTFTSILSIE